MKSSIWALMGLVLRKELTVSRRFSAAWAAMGMFVLTALSAMSLALAGQALSPQLSAYAFKASFCFLFNFFGVSTTIVTN